MTLKVFIYLSLIAIVNSSEYHDEHEPLIAYSSVYTSLGSHITEADDTTEDAKTNSPDVDNTRTQSSPIYEIVIGQNDNGGNQQQTKTQTLDNDSKPSSKLPSEPTVPQLQPKYIEPQVLISVPANINSLYTTNPPLSSAIIGKSRLLTPGLSAFASSGEESDNEPAKITILDTSNVTPRSIAPPSNDAQSDFFIATTDSKIQKESKATDSKSSDAESDESFNGFRTSYSW